MLQISKLNKYLHICQYLTIQIIAKSTQIIATKAKWNDQTKVCVLNNVSNFKVILSGLGQFLAAESPLKMIKNAFLFHVKSSFHSQDS